MLRWKQNRSHFLIGSRSEKSFPNRTRRIAAANFCVQIRHRAFCEIVDLGLYFSDFRDDESPQSVQKPLWTGRISDSGSEIAV
jgi:hypothetical protein